MADVTYTVEVQYLTKGNLLGNMGGLQQSIDALNKTMSAGIGKGLNLGDAIRGNIERSSGPAAAAGASLGEIISAGMIANLAVSAVGSAISGIGKAAMIGLQEMNGEVERLSITMAMMFTGSGQVQSFNQGMEASAELMRRMRKDARELPGEFTDLANIMLRVTTPAAKAGLSVGETERIAANAMAVGVGAGLRPDVVGRELADMIGGRMRRMMPLTNILPNFNMESKEFNALPIEKRVARLKQALGMVEGTKEFEAVTSMRQAFEHSWVGLWSSLKDNAKLTLGSVTAELFDHIKNALIRFNTWFYANQEKIETWAHRVGHFMAVGFDRALAAAEKIAPIAMMIGDKLVNRDKESTLGRDLGMLGGILAAGKAASFLAPLLGGGGGAAAAGAGVAEAGGAAVAAGGGAALGPLLIIAAALFGVIEGLTNDLGPLYRDFQILSGTIQLIAKDAFAHLKHAFMEMWPVLKRLAELMGLEVMASFTIFLSGLTLFLQLCDAVVTKLIEWGGKLRDLLRAGPLSSDTFRFLDPDKKPRVDMEVVNRHKPVDLEALKATEKPPVHNTTIHKVEINVNSNQDPNRIAKRTLDIIKDFATHPKSAYQSGAPRLTSTI